MECFLIIEVKIGLSAFSIAFIMRSVVKGTKILITSILYRTQTEIVSSEVSYDLIGTFLMKISDYIIKYYIYIFKDQNNYLYNL